MKKHLTDLAIERLRTPKSGQTEIFDLGYPGLALRIGYGGAKSFTLFYRHGDKLHRQTLGRWPETTLAAAREAWRRTREAVARGEDPSPKNGKPNGSAFEVVAEEWLRRDVGTNSRVSTARQIARLIEHDAIPAWRGRSVDSIARHEIIRLIDGVIDRGSPAMAVRLHAELRRLFKWCHKRGIIAVDPAAGLDEKPAKIESRDRVLTDTELVHIWHASEGLYGYMYKLLILTGLRREQIGRLRWSEIRGDELHLEGERTKNGEPFILPLSAAARATLSAVPRTSDEYVFSVDGQSHANSWYRAKLATDSASGISDWRVHDFRRTLATGMQRLGIEERVVEACLGHTAGRRKGIVRVYQRHDFASEKRQALEAWGAHVLSLVK